MKRSEMVDLIYNVLINLATEDNIPAPPLRYDQVSDVLLRQIENAGMCPPKGYKLNYKNELVCGRVWENEDD